MFAKLAARLTPTRAAAARQGPSESTAETVMPDLARAGWFESSWELMAGLDVCEREFDPGDFQFA